MTSLLAAVLIGFQGQTEVKKVLPNGATYHCKQTETPGQFRLSLCLSSFALPDKEGESGLRHLLEHLVAKGQKKDLDRRLESVGCWLTADTDRDSLVFTVTGPSSQAVLGFAAIKDILGPLQTTQAEITREVEILRQEGALHPPYRPFVDGAWDSAYGLAGSFGDLVFLSKQTPELLSAAKAKQFSGSAAFLFLEGDIDAKASALRAEEVLSPMPRGSNPLARREAMPPGDPVKVKGRGAALAVPVSGLGDPMTPASVGVAIWLSRKVPGSEAIYDPSGWPGTVTLWCPDPGMVAEVAALAATFPAEAVRDARYYAIAWANGLNLPGPIQDRLSAKLAMQAPNFDVTKLATQSRGLTNEELARAAMQWKKGYAYEIRGAE